MQNGVFVDDQCKEFTFSGYNTWQPIEAALDICCGGRTALIGQFKEAGERSASKHVGLIPYMSSLWSQG